MDMSSDRRATDQAGQRDTGDPFSDFDPFAGLVDAEDRGAAGQRADLLDAARRGYFPLRKVFVQRPSTEATRASMLAALVAGRHHRPLDLLLLMHALMPVLDGSPLPLGTWARLMSVSSPCSRTAVTRAFETLIDLNLVTRVRGGSIPQYVPLMEDGSKTPWVKAGLDQEEGPGFFTVPHAYWQDGWSETLRLPGKAMLLILLAETQSPTRTTFAMPVERAHDWYGISERTAERGYTELSRAGLMDVKVVKTPDKRHPAGRRAVYHRALARPFRTPDRAALQKAATQAARTKAAASSADLAGRDSQPKTLATS